MYGYRDIGDNYKKRKASGSFTGGFLFTYQ
jgi:hypothetical protein